MDSNLSRRDFIKVSAGTALVTGLPNASAKTQYPATAVDANDRAVEKGIDAQVLDKNHPFYGGIPDHRELYQARTAGYFVQHAVAAYCCEASRYKGSEGVLKRIQLAQTFLENSQSRDGNIDLLSTNFNSPPDTGFVVHTVANAANVARLNGQDELSHLFKAFLLAAGDGMAKGGIHTPNHRWVVSAALAQINELFPNQRYIKRIDQWLAEKVDIDEEGQYTERSTGGYNAVCDYAFITLAHKLNREELFEPVRKNLNAMAYLIHPNGEVVTEFSNRQDRNTQATMERYWFSLRYMAIKDNNGLYASMLKPHEPHAMDLPELMEYQELSKALPTPTPIPQEYDIDLPNSGITRMRRAKTSATLIHRGNSRWISMHHGNAIINGVRFASAFFGKGQFIPKKFQREGDELCFYQSLEGRYYQPFTDAKDLPVEQRDVGKRRGRRKVSEVCTMEYEGRVRPTERGFSLTIKATGTKGVPLAVEINLRSDTHLSGVEDLGDGRYLLKEGMAEYKVGNDVIKIGPGKADHRYVQIRGAEEKLSGPSVYLTGYTPFETTLEIEVS